MKKDLTAYISSVVSHLKVNESLKNYTTFHIGGPAKYFVDVNDFKELRKLWGIARQVNMPLYILGAGSNVLIGDHGLDGIVVRLSGEFLLYTFGRNIVKTGAGVRLHTLSRECIEKEFAGFECLSGIPGTIGGALVSNAGTYLGNIGDIVVSVEVISKIGKIETLSRDKLNFFYRGSNLDGRIILSATLNLKKGQKNDILKRVDELVFRRSENQPLGQWSAGSVFKNPKGRSAGQLIEEAGLKGLTFGGAKVSEKHANFIINTEDARASDVRTLISMIRQKVKEQFGVDLELEIKIIGE